jgi:hypothetical protein
LPDYNQSGKICTLKGRYEDIISVKKDDSALLAPLPGGDEAEANKKKADCPESDNSAVVPLSSVSAESP